jgi:hypothetical protein
VELTAPASGPRLKIGISACLLGQEVRFDGGHKRDQFLTEVLGPHVEWVPLCPEVEMAWAHRARRFDSSGLPGTPDCG